MVTSIPLMLWSSLKRARRCAQSWLKRIPTPTMLLSEPNVIKCSVSRIVANWLHKPPTGELSTRTCPNQARR